MQSDVIADPDPETLRDLPPTARLVYVVLQHEGPLTQSDVVEHSYTCDRTVRDALKDLVDENLITTRASLQDARKTFYDVPGGDA